MARVHNISHCPVIALDDLDLTAEPIARALLAPGGGETPSRPMLWPCPLAEAAPPHSGATHAFDAEVFFVRDAQAGGPGSHGQKDGAFLFAEGVYPGYVSHYVFNDIAPENWSLSGAEIISLDRAFVINHFNIVYGHWLLEMFPKLFTIRVLAEAGVVAPILLPSITPRYMIDAINAVTPDQEVILYDQDTQVFNVKTLMLPSMLNRAYIFHPLFEAGLQRLIEDTPAPPRAPDAIFVSRSGIDQKNGYRRHENAAEIERRAHGLGLTVVHPQKLGWREQVRLFAGARLIVGEFGSGLHNALFSPPGAKVVALNWIVDVQSRIANFRRQDVGYVLPVDGRPRLFTLEDAINDPAFEIDPDLFSARVAPLVEGLRRNLVWRLRAWWNHRLAGRLSGLAGKTAA